MSDLNDPRVFFAAERTLMAWTRTSLTLLAFGFMIERFGLFLLLFALQNGAAHTGAALQRGLSYWVGVAFMLLGSVAAIFSVMQYRKVLGTLKPVEIPAGYRVNLGAYINIAVAILGIVLTLYLLKGLRL